MGNDIVDAARSFLGVPFHHQGRTWAGLDCGGLVVLAYRKAGLDVADASGYARQPFSGALRKVLSESFRIVFSPEPGDVLLIAFADQPQHLAIYAGRTIIHSYERAGKVIEHRFADVWRARVRGIYRYVG